MALGIFARTCAKNVSGAQRVFIAEKSIVTGITVATGEISAITGTTPFMRVDAEMDSIHWNQKETQVGQNNTKFENVLDFNVVPPALATNTFLQALTDGSPCGLLAIVIDGNSKCWLVGYNATDLMNRPLRKMEEDTDTGTSPADEAGQVVKVKLGNVCGGRALPFDTTLTAAIIGGTSTIIKWS